MEKLYWQHQHQHQLRVKTRLRWIDHLIENGNFCFMTGKSTKTRRSPVCLNLMVILSTEQFSHQSQDLVQRRDQEALVQPQPRLTQNPTSFNCDQLVESSNFTDRSSMTQGIPVCFIQASKKGSKVESKCMEQSKLMEFELADAVPPPDLVDPADRPQFCDDDFVVGIVMIEKNSQN